MLKVVNLALFAFMVVMNYLANALPINGKTTGELSDQYPNLFVPAGITFSIWGVIYILLLIFVLFQFRESYKDLVQTIGFAFAISCLLNGLWIVAWHYEKLPLSLVIMVGLLIALVFINQKLIAHSNILVKTTFGVYLGWICIATIANVTALLVNYNWGGWGLPHEAWSIIMISVGAIIAILTIMRMSNPFVGLSVIWAFIGIAIKRQGDYPSIAIIALVGAGIMAIASIWMFIRIRGIGA